MIRSLPPPTRYDQGHAIAESGPRPVTSPFIEKGTPEFRRTNLALFAAGFSTFALLYCVQPLMPEFSRDFHVSPAESSLSISLTTGLLAISMLVAGSISEAWGRKPMMVAALFASAALTVISALMPNWRGLLATRALEGVTFSGLPAIAMAYLSEEMGRDAIGLAMGLVYRRLGAGRHVGTSANGRAHRFSIVAVRDRDHRRARAAGRIYFLAQPSAIATLP